MTFLSVQRIELEAVDDVNGENGNTADLSRR